MMRDGGYFWRRPGIEHGPFATRWRRSSPVPLPRRRICNRVEWVRRSKLDTEIHSRLSVLPFDYQTHVGDVKNYDSEPNC